MKIALLNQKGGVGKTTIAVNLAYGLSRVGKRTLLIDLDPQAHASMVYCDDNLDGTIEEIFERQDAKLAELVRPARVGGVAADGLFVVPSNIHLAVTTERLLLQHYRERRLHVQLETLLDSYDFIILDCPPNLGLITVNAIYTADELLVPITFGRYALEGTADLLGSIREIREGDWRAWWILRNAYDSRTSTTNAYIDTELEALSSHVMKTVIRRSEPINQAQIKGEPVLVFDPRGYGAADFQTLTTEVLSHGKEA